MCEDNFIETSIIIPVLNEELHIDSLLNSISQQTYDSNKFEVIFVDGGSFDKTKEKIINYAQNTIFPIRLLDNQKKTTQYAMNSGIDAAKGIYIIRLDAHSSYPINYFEVLVEELKCHPEIGNVGGICKVIGKDTVGECYAIVLSTIFGVGKSDFRISKEKKYVNTVPFGAFRKDELIKIGKYDEVLERNEDYELNLRYIQNGYKILLNPELVITYYCRDTISSIWNHEISDGIWNTLSFIHKSYTFSLSHFIPLLFVLSLIVMPLLISVNVGFKYLFSIELILYLLLDITFSLIYSEKKLKYFYTLLILYPVHHLGCGIGELIGIFKPKK